MKLPEQVCITFTNGLPTVFRSFRGHEKPIICIKLGNGGCVVPVECPVKTSKLTHEPAGPLLDRPRLFVGRSSAKKPVANPAKAISKRIFLVFSGVYEELSPDRDAIGYCGDGVAADAGGGVTLKVSNRVFQVSPSRTLIADQKPLRFIGSPLLP